MGEPIDMAKALAEALMQDISYQLGDVINQYPAALQPYVMAVLRSILAAVLATFSEEDLKLYEHLVERTVMMTLPKSMDPRKEGGKE